MVVALSSPDHLLGFDGAMANSGAQQAPPSNGADDARQVPFCCPKLGTQPIFNSPARVVPLVPAIDLSSVVAFPARPLFVLPVGSAATTARSDGGQMVEGGIHYVISRKHDQCVVARPNVWKGEELCDCKSDGCKTCDERLSTVAQKEDDSALSSVADSVCTERGSPSMSVEDDNSVRSEKDMAASSMSEGDFRNRAQSSARVRSLASGTTAKHGHAAFPMPIKPEPLEDGATARSSLFKGADEFSDDQDLAYLLRALAGEGTDKEMLSTSDLGRSTSSLETLFDIDTGKSGLGGSDKASAPSLDDDLDGDGPDGGKKVLRNAADEHVVEKLFGDNPVTREKVMQIASMPVHELNKLMQQANVTEAEASLIRDIRRRGKNKIAARNCRKRKLETISDLERDVELLNEKRKRLEAERDRVREDALRYKKCMHHLRRFIMKSLNKPTRGSSNLSASASSVDLTSSLSVAGSEGFPSTPFSQSLDNSVFSPVNSNNLSSASLHMATNSQGNAFDLPPPSAADVATGLAAVNNYASSVHSSIPDMQQLSPGSQHNDAASLARSQLGESVQAPSINQAQLVAAPVSNSPVVSGSGASAAVSYEQMNVAAAAAGLVPTQAFNIFTPAATAGVVNLPIAAATGWPQQPTIWSSFPPNY